MKKDLVTTFTNGLGKEHDWTYKDVNAELPPQVIKEACELLTSLDIFEQNGVKLFDSVVTAKIVTTKETEIFDVKNDPKIEKNESLEQRKASVKTAQPTELPRVKTGNNYDYLFEPSKNAIAKKLEGPVEIPSRHPSLLINTPQIGEPDIPKIEDNSVSESTKDTTQPDSVKQSRTRKSFLQWIRRKKNQNKDDPDIHSRDPESYN